MLKRLILGFSLAALLALGSGTAFASKLHPCNSGSGNGFETTVTADCDPGNSGANNNGGG
jgi:hypothetical protein